MNKSDLRYEAARQSLRLFEEQGFENTSVDQIAQASGVSRRTLFRQFGTKEDIIFADHEVLLGEIASYLKSRVEAPWHAVLESAHLVFEHFSHNMEFSQHRYRVVRAVPNLRAREIVTVFRYEQLYSEFLRSHVPESENLKAVIFSAAITSAHNYVLRRMLRNECENPLTELNRALVQVAATFGITEEDPTIPGEELHNQIVRELHQLLKKLENFDEQNSTQ